MENRDWQSAVVDRCWQVIYAGGGEVRIVFAKRKPGNKFKPDIYFYPENKESCKEFEIPED